MVSSHDADELPTLAYRVGLLEKSYEQMADALSNIVAEVRMAKWIIGLSIAVIEPVVIALLIHYLIQR